MNTTAGSFALLNSVVPRDAGVVSRLKAAGAIILGVYSGLINSLHLLIHTLILAGKANLSEFAHFRGTQASGWSGRGGQSTSAYFPGRTHPSFPFFLS